MESEANSHTIHTIVRRPDGYLISLVVALLLWPSLQIQFVSDNIGHIVSAPGHFADLDFHFYRPLTILTLALDYAIWGLRPFGFHLTNLFLHLIATFLVYLFAIRLTGKRVVAVVASFLFGLHPIHSMSIFWISGRVDIVCTIFYLGSLISLMSFVRTSYHTHLILSLILYICAIGSKEMGLSLPLVVAAYLWIFSESKNANRFKRTFSIIIPYIGITLGYFVLKYSFVGTDAFATGAHTNFSPVHLLKNVAMFGGFLVVPGYHAEIGVYLQSHRTLFVMLAAVAFTALVVSFRWIVRSKVALFSILFIVLTLVPVVRLAMRWYLYLPSVGFCLLLGYITDRWWERSDKKLPIAAAVTIVATIYAFFLVHEQTNWVRAGQISDKVSTEVASTMLNERISTAYVLTVPAEINQTPILIFGLGSNVNARLQQIDRTADTVDVRPMLLISLASEDDYSRCRIEQVNKSSFNISLESTESYFVFPEDMELVSGEQVLHINDTIETDAFAVIINHVNQGGEADFVTVQLYNIDIPVLWFMDDSFQIAGSDRTAWAPVTGHFPLSLMFAPYGI